MMVVRSISLRPVRGSSSSGNMQMPVMDGVTATQEIRKEARFKDLPVVIGGIWAVGALNRAYSAGRERGGAVAWDSRPRLDWAAPTARRATCLSRVGQAFLPARCPCLPPDLCQTPGAGIPACPSFPAQRGMSAPPCCPLRSLRAGGAVQSGLGRSEAKS